MPRQLRWLDKFSVARFCALRYASAKPFHSKFAAYGGVKGRSMRAPFQVIVFPFRELNDSIEVLIGKRSDDGVWQGISGGGEDAETPLEAARRELFEEAGLIGKSWFQLDSKVMLPKVFYKGHEEWDKEIYVIPEHAFATEVSGVECSSAEHSELIWVSADVAETMLKYDSNIIALWEMCQRIRRRDTYQFALVYQEKC